MYKDLYMHAPEVGAEQDGEHDSARRTSIKGNGGSPLPRDLTKKKNKWRRFEFHCAQVFEWECVR